MGGQKRQIIEYLRGLAALSVAWFHLTNGYDPGLAQISGSWGWLGVEVFFVISGFIISYSLSALAPAYSWNEFPRFIARRVTRIEIPYLVSIAMVLLLWTLSAMAPGFAGTQPSFDPVQVASHVFYLVPLTEHDWLQPVYWTLMYEFVFYIFMGLAFPVIGRKDQIWSALIVSGLVAGLVLLGLPDRVLLFVAGFWLYRFLCHNERTGLFVSSVALLMLAFDSIPEAIAGGASALAIAIFWRTNFKANLVTQSLGFLGTISYSLYLVHVPIGGRVVNFGQRFIAGEMQQFGLSMLALAISICFAWLFWRFVERPAIGLARKLSKSHREPRIATVSDAGAA